MEGLLFIFFLPFPAVLCGLEVRAFEGKGREWHHRRSLKLTKSSY